MTPLMSVDDNVVSGLKAVGLAPDDICVVICSHLHPDHCGCNAYFTRATIICHADELAAARGPEGLQAGYLPADWDHPQTFDAIDGSRDLFDDGKLVVLPLPGHTPGTIGALVTLERSGAFLLASDAVSVRASLDQDVTPRNTWNVDALQRSLSEIRRIEAKGATVICGHDDAQWRTLKKGADAYE
jgi:glyoxylase-like metal-dependent hydrolase (beta-lactamase superfamily II)